MSKKLPFGLEEEIIEDIVVLRLKGQIRAEYSKILKDKLLEYIEQKGLKKIILNLDEVSFLNSSALSVILEIYKKLKNMNGKLLIAEPSKEVENLLDITRLNTIFEIYETEREAINII